LSKSQCMSSIRVKREPWTETFEFSASYICLCFRGIGLYLVSSCAVFTSSIDVRFPFGLRPPHYYLSNAGISFLNSYFFLFFLLYTQFRVPFPLISKIFYRWFAVFPSEKWTITSLWTFGYVLILGTLWPSAICAWFGLEQRGTHFLFVELCSCSSLWGSSSIFFWSHLLSYQALAPKLLALYKIYLEDWGLCKSISQPC